MRTNYNTAHARGGKRAGSEDARAARRQSSITVVHKQGVRRLPAANPKPCITLSNLGGASFSALPRTAAHSTQSISFKRCASSRSPWRNTQHTDRGPLASPSSSRPAWAARGARPLPRRRARRRRLDVARRPWASASPAPAQRIGTQAVGQRDARSRLWGCM